jgi:hypothetical protein
MLVELWATPCIHTQKTPPRRGLCYQSVICLFSHINNTGIQCILFNRVNTIVSCIFRLIVLTRANYLSISRLEDEHVHSNLGVFTLITAIVCSILLYRFNYIVLTGLLFITLTNENNLTIACLKTEAKFTTLIFIQFKFPRQVIPPCLSVRNFITPSFLHNFLN